MPYIPSDSAAPVPRAKCYLLGFRDPYYLSEKQVNVTGTLNAVKVRQICCPDHPIVQVRPAEQSSASRVEDRVPVLLVASIQIRHTSRRSSRSPMYLVKRLRELPARCLGAA